jgi:putative lipoic acid-binding regulatory protein
MQSQKAGSFFHNVPEDNNNNNNDGDDDRSDKDPKQPSKPHTHTSDLQNLFKGFGKTSSSSSSVSSFSRTPTASLRVDVATSRTYVGIGPASVNDVTNPETDAQGYTLYQDERTGEKSRVFEALVDYPCLFTMKIVGANEGSFVDDILDIVADTCNVETGRKDISHSVKHNGKWTSVTVQAPVHNAAMLYQLYENVDRDPRVKFKF